MTGGHLSGRTFGVKGSDVLPVTSVLSRALFWGLPLLDVGISLVLFGAERWFVCVSRDSCAGRRWLGPWMGQQLPVFAAYLLLLPGNVMLPGPQEHHDCALGDQAPNV